MVRIWNSDNMQCVQVINTGCTVAALKLCCGHLAVGSFNASATLWTLPTSELLGRYVGHTSAVFSVNFNHFLDIFITGSADKTVILWSLMNKTPLHSIQTSFKPSSMHFVFPSEILHQSSSFMLVANNSAKCKAWLVNFRSSNIIVSSMKLPSETADIAHLQSNTVSVDVACSKKLILACQVPTGIAECCISFKSSEPGYKSGESTSNNYIKDSSLAEPQNMLDFSYRDIALLDNQQLMLLAAGSCFSVYMRRHCKIKELLLVHHSSASQSEFVWRLPHNCRWLRWV